MSEDFQIRTYGDPTLPTLIYLPGLHGDWTLITGFRIALGQSINFVEITYPQSTVGTIEEHAQRINRKLLDLGISSGWLLGESFGSQLAWALLGMNLNHDAPANKNCFRAHGLILAGGFVKHPWKWGPRNLIRLGSMTPKWAYHLGLGMFGAYSSLIYRSEPELLNSMKEFVRRRTDSDRLAMRHRLGMLEHYDPSPVAKQTRLPVYYLDGLFDPLVPWFQVCGWLKKNCPGYKCAKILCWTNHNVLHGSPKYTAKLVLQWMNLPLSSRK